MYFFFGIIYEFKKGEGIECGSWCHLLNIILKVLDIYEEIFISEKIKAIKHIPSN